MIISTKNEKQKVINNFSNTVGYALRKNKDLINSTYVAKGNLVDTTKNIFTKENILDNPYTATVINNLKAKRNLDSQVMYLYDIILAGDGLKVTK